ncbi:MAG TPA: alpha/beta hydrolase, partial [Chryseobacterium indologenes]|nr:alpha/beta hydrolase [Chryseobacterium indologenes]
MNTPLNFSKKIRFVLSFVIVMGLGLMSLKAQTYTSEDVASAFTNTKKIRAGLLDVGYAEVGPENGK